MVYELVITDSLLESLKIPEFKMQEPKPKDQLVEAIKADSIFYNIICTKLVELIMQASSNQAQLKLKNILVKLIKDVYVLTHPQTNILLSNKVILENKREQMKNKILEN